MNGLVEDALTLLVRMMIAAAIVLIGFNLHGNALGMIKNVIKTLGG